MRQRILLRQARLTAIGAEEDRVAAAAQRRILLGAAAGDALRESQRHQAADRALVLAGALVRIGNAQELPHRLAHAPLRGGIGAAVAEALHRLLQIAAAVALVQHRSQPRRRTGEVQGPGSDQHVAEARRGRQAPDLAAMRRDAAGFVDRAERTQQLGGVTPGRRGRRIEQGQLRHVGAPGRQLKGEARQVGGEDFRRVVRRQRGMLVAAPQAVGRAGAETAGAAGALVGAGARDALRLQAIGASAEVEAGDARIAAVDHGAHALHRQAGLGDVGGENDLAAAVARWLQRGVLLGGGQVAVQGRQVYAAGGARFEQALRIADFAAAGKEGEDVALGFVERPQRALAHRLAQLGAGARRHVAHIHRVELAATLDNLRVAKEGGDASRIQRRRHHQHPQRLIQRGARVQGQRQGEIGVEAALVELVEDHQAYAGQFRVGLQAPRQQALGDDLDACRGRDPAVEADLVAHRLADLLAQQPGHAGGAGAGGDAPWLQHHDALARQPGFVEQGQRHEGGLARAGRRGQHRLAGLRQRRAQARQCFRYGQVGECGLHGFRRRRCVPATRCAPAACCARTH